MGKCLVKASYLVVVLASPNYTLVDYFAAQR
jgi:hypothetical protein